MRFACYAAVSLAIYVTSLINESLVATRGLM